MHRFKRLWYYLLLLLFISITIIVLDNLNSPPFEIPKVVQDINSGVIGAILTTIITLVLLANQTENEEVLQKKSVIYGEKLRIFNEFLRSLGESIKDGKLSKEELKVLIYSYALVRMNLTADNARRLEALLGEINEEFFYVDENLVPNYQRHIELFGGICEVFKGELYGTPVGEASIPQFINFYQISYNPRIKNIVVQDFDDMLSQIRRFQKVIWIEKENTVSFDLQKELVANFEHTFRMIDAATLVPGTVPLLQRIFNLSYYRINDKQHLKCPHVSYQVDGKSIIEIWIERLNRVVVYLKLEDRAKGEQKTVRRFQIEGPEDIPALIPDVVDHLTRTIASRTHLPPTAVSVSG
jgi:hypothetical protein